MLKLFLPFALLGKVNHTHHFGELPLKRIAVLRALGGLGDLLCAVPALRALRAAHRQAETVLIGLGAIEPLVRRFDRYLDALLAFPGYPGLPEQPLQVQKIPAFFQLTQEMHFDLVIQMHGSGLITNPLTVMLGARFNAGFFIPSQYCPDENRFLPYLAQESEVRRYLRLLEFLGIPNQGEELEFPIYAEDKQALREIDDVRNLIKGNYVCIHPGASTSDRCWFPEGFAEVADKLAQLGFSVILTGSKHEVDLCRRVASMMKASSINLAGRTNLGALAALVQDARLLVCNDTGVSHLAAALRVKSVILFTQSDPNRWAPLDRDRHRIVEPATATTSDNAIAQAIDLLQKEDVYTAV